MAEVTDSRESLVEPTGWRPAKRDIRVAVLIDFLLRFASPTMREVVKTGTKRAIADAATVPFVPASEVVRSRG